MASSFVMVALLLLTIILWPQPAQAASVGWTIQSGGLTCYGTAPASAVWNHQSATGTCKGSGTWRLWISCAGWEPDTFTPWHTQHGGPYTVTDNCWGDIRGAHYQFK